MYTCVFTFQLTNFERGYTDLPMEENKDERKQKTPIHRGLMND